MSYKPDEISLIAYLYDELSGEEKEKVEHYLLENAQARQELEKLQGLRSMMRSVEDKEVIAPPIFFDERRTVRFWQSPYFRTIITIAASILLLMVAGWVTDARINIHDNTLTLGFGAPQQPAEKIVEQPATNALTKEDVEEMINTSLATNNENLQSNWVANQQKLNASIKQNLADNSGKIDQLVRQASLASQEQIQQYVSSLQAQQMTAVRDYFQLTSTDQKKYIEDLLVDFSKYLQQQRNDDLLLMQTRLLNLEKNTSIFKQETEQILTSIISNSTPVDNSTKN